MTVLLLELDMFRTFRIKHLLKGCTIKSSYALPSHGLLIYKPFAMDLSKCPGPPLNILSSKCKLVLYARVHYSYFVSINDLNCPPPPPPSPSIALKQNQILEIYQTTTNVFKAGCLSFNENIKISGITKRELNAFRRIDCHHICKSH